MHCYVKEKDGELHTYKVEGAADHKEAIKLVEDEILDQKDSPVLVLIPGGKK